MKGSLHEIYVNISNPRKLNSLGGKWAITSFACWIHCCCYCVFIFMIFFYFFSIVLIAFQSMRSKPEGRTPQESGEKCHDTPDAIIEQPIRGQPAWEMVAMEQGIIDKWTEAIDKDDISSIQQIYRDLSPIKQLSLLYKQLPMSDLDPCGHANISCGCHLKLPKEIHNHCTKSSTI